MSTRRPDSFKIVIERASGGLAASRAVGVIARRVRSWRSIAGWFYLLLD